jgi:hypothetical protein
MKKNQMSQTIIIIIIASFFVSCTPTETVKITNEISDETIYLRYWGYDHPISTISLNRFADIDTCYDFIMKNEGDFFYKLKNDTLFISTYGLKVPSENNIKKRYKTKIIYQEMENGNADFCDFCRKYKKLGYEIFPPSFAYYAKNIAEDSVH